MDPEPLEAHITHTNQLVSFFITSSLTTGKSKRCFEMQGPCWEGGFKEDLQEGPWAKSRRYASIWWWERLMFRRESAK